MTATPSNIVGTLSCKWDFGDGTAGNTNFAPTHSYTESGNYVWRVVTMVDSTGASASVTNSGMISITAKETLQVVQSASAHLLSWANYPGDALLEWAPALGPAAAWTVDTNAVSRSPDTVWIQSAKSGAARFYRLRKL